MSANSRLVFVTEKHCALCAIMNEVLIRVSVSLTMCILGISSVLHSVVCVRSDPSEQHALKGLECDLTKHVHARKFPLRLHAVPIVTMNSAPL